MAVFGLRLEPAAELMVPVALLQPHSSRGPTAHSSGGRLHRCEHRWIALQLATELRESLAQQLQRPAAVPLDEAIRGMPPQGRRHGLGVDPGLQLPQGLGGLAQQQAAQRAGGFPGRVGLSTLNVFIEVRLQSFPARAIKLDGCGRFLLPRSIKLLDNSGVRFLTRAPGEKGLLSSTLVARRCRGRTCA